jgi:hypothetical protein
MRASTEAGATRPAGTAEREYDEPDSTAVSLFGAGDVRIENVTDARFLW